MFLYSAGYKNNSCLLFSLPLPVLCPPLYFCAYMGRGYTQFGQQGRQGFANHPGKGKTGEGARIFKLVQLPGGKKNRASYKTPVLTINSSQAVHGFHTSRTRCLFPRCIHQLLLSLYNIKNIKIFCVVLQGQDQSPLVQSFSFFVPGPIYKHR